MITPSEPLRLQGFPERFRIVGGDSTDQETDRRGARAMVRAVIREVMIRQVKTPAERRSTSRIRYRNRSFRATERTSTLHADMTGDTRPRRWTVLEATWDRGCRMERLLLVGQDSQESGPPQCLSHSPDKWNAQSPFTRREWMRPSLQRTGQSVLDVLAMARRDHDDLRLVGWCVLWVLRHFQAARAIVPLAPNNTMEKE